MEHLWLHMIVGAAIIVLGYIGKGIVDKLVKKDCVNCPPIIEVKADMKELKDDFKAGIKELNADLKTWGQDVKEDISTVHKRLDAVLLTELQKVKERDARKL